MASQLTPKLAAGEVGFALIRNAADRLARAQGIEEVVETIRTYARRLSGADGIAIILKDGSSCHYVEEDAIAPLWKGGRFPLESCVSGWAMLNRQTAVIPDILTDARVPQDAYRSTFVRSMAMAPMGTSAPAGAIGAYWAETYFPSPVEIDALEALAAEAGEALARLGHEGVPARPIEAPSILARLALRLNSFEIPQRFLRIVPPRTLGFWTGQALAASLVLVLAALRAAIFPLVGATGVFIAFVPAILISALWAGPWAAVTAVALSSLAGTAIGYHFAGAELGWIVFLPVAALTALVACSVRTALDFHKGHTDTLEEREKQLSTIARELDHRSKNTLAVVSALTHHAEQSSATTAEMRDRLCGHFDAMRTAQALLLEVGDRRLPLLGLLERALLPFLREKRVLLNVDPSLECPAGCEVMLSLAFSELATNACKYGALSAPNGEIEVSARRENGRVSLIWSESGGPRVQPPAHASAGSRLLKRALSGAVDGQVEPSFLPAGAVCRFGWREDDPAEHP